MLLLCGCSLEVAWQPVNTSGGGFSQPRNSPAHITPAKLQFSVLQFLYGSEKQDVMC